MSRLYRSYANSLFGSIVSNTDYYIVRQFRLTRQTGGNNGDVVENRTTITYYELKQPQPFLALVRYTAYGNDGKALKVFEGVYDNDPDEFCRLENDIETALKGGIDTSIQSEYEYEIFPVISSYLT